MRVGAHVRRRAGGVDFYTAVVQIARVAGELQFGCSALDEVAEAHSLYASANEVTSGGCCHLKLRRGRRRNAAPGGLLEGVADLEQSRFGAGHTRESHAERLRPGFETGRESRPALEQYVSGPVVYELLAILCIPDLPGIDPQQNLGESAFLCHLLQHSAWIQNALSGGLLGQGERLVFPLGMQSEAMRAADRERLLAELKSMPAPDPRAGNEKRVADLKSRLPRFGTAGLIAKVLESQAGRILPAGAGESVEDRIANLQRMLQVSLSNAEDLTVLYQM